MQAGDQRHRGFGNPANGQQPRIKAGDRDNDEDESGQVHRTRGGLEDLMQRRFAIDEIADDDRVDAGDAGGFRRREHARIDAAEYDGDVADGPDAVPRGEQEFFEREFSALHDSDAPRMIIDVNTKHSGQQKTRADAGGEQLDNRGIRGDAINDHGDRRRNEIVERAFRRNQRRGKPLAVSRFAHSRIGQGADGGGWGGSYARNRAAERRNTERRHRDM